MRSLTTGVICVRWLGSVTPGCAVIIPVCARYTRLAFCSNSNTFGSSGLTDFDENISTKGSYHLRCTESL